MVKFTVPGEVRGKGRPRFTKAGNHVRTYTDSSTVNYENWVKICFQEAKQKMLIGQLKAEIRRRKKGKWEVKNERNNIVS